jgi:protein associated with RNAse G/E
VAETDSYVLTYMPAGTVVTHFTRGITFAQAFPTFAFWYRSPRFYSIHIGVDGDGNLLRIYCNVNTPVSIGNGTLQVVDLDLDVVVQPDLAWTVVDQDEFELNARERRYPQAWIQAATSAVAELTRLIEAREHPFCLTAGDFRALLATRSQS